MSDHPIIPADQVLPPRLFVVPLRGKPIFPGILTPLVPALARPRRTRSRRPWPATASSGSC